MSSPLDDQDPKSDGSSRRGLQEAARSIEVSRSDGINIESDNAVPLNRRPEFNNLSAPTTLQHHALIQSRYFFTLPERLLDHLTDEIGSDRFDSEMLELEKALGRICGDHATQAGFWRGTAFSYRFLREAAPLHLQPETLEGLNWGKNPAQLDQICRLLSPSLNSLSNASRGYLGWLLTNRLFLADHDALLTQYASVIEYWGTAMLGLEAPPPGFEQATTEQRSNYRVASDAAFEFLQRWRLQNLVAPYLPNPLEAQLSGIEPPLRQYQQAAGKFQIPDTVPIPSRDELRQLLDAASCNQSHEHLAAWRQIVATNNMAKQELGRYARLFEIQHYCRIFRHRHPDASCRTLSKIKLALAEFFGVVERTIHQDLLTIRERLDDGWQERTTGWSFGPF